MRPLQMRNPEGFCSLFSPARPKGLAYRLLSGSYQGQTLDKALLQSEVLK